MQQGPIAPLPGLHLANKFACELSTSDFLEGCSHVFGDVLIHNSWPNCHLPPLCGIGNQVAHSCNPDLVDHVDDKFEFMQTFKVGQLWGITGIQKEAVLAAQHSIVTVEEIVPLLEPTPGATVIPGWVITAVAEAPAGARPSYAHGYYERDNGFYQEWEEISRDRVRFTAWMEDHVLQTVDTR